MEKARFRRYLGGGELQRVERGERGVAGAGEIVSLAGVETSGAGVNATLVHPEGWGYEGPRALPVRSSIFFPSP